MIPALMAADWLWKLDCITIWKGNNFEPRLGQQEWKETNMNYSDSKKRRNKSWTPPSINVWNGYYEIKDHFMNVLISVLFWCLGIPDAAMVPDVLSLLVSPCMPRRVELRCNQGDHTTPLTHVPCCHANRTEWGENSGSVLWMKGWCHSKGTFC